MSEQTSTQVTTPRSKFFAGELSLVTRLLVPEVIVLVLLGIVSLFCAIMFPEQMAELALRF